MGLWSDRIGPFWLASSHVGDCKFGWLYGSIKILFTLICSYFHLCILCRRKIFFTLACCYFDACISWRSMLLTSKFCNGDFRKNTGADKESSKADNSFGKLLERVWNIIYSMVLHRNYLFLAWWGYSKRLPCFFLNGTTYRVFFSWSKRIIPC